MRRITRVTVVLSVVLGSTCLPAQEETVRDVEHLIDRARQLAVRDPAFVDKLAGLIDVQSPDGQAHAPRDTSAALVPLPRPTPKTVSESEPAGVTELRQNLERLQSAISTIELQISELKSELAERTRVGGLTKTGDFLESTACTLVVQNQVPYPVELDVAFTDMLDVRKTVRITVAAHATHRIEVRTAADKEVLAVRLPQNPDEKPMLFRLSGPAYELVLPVYWARRGGHASPAGVTQVYRASLSDK